MFYLTLLVNFVRCLLHTDDNDWFGISTYYSKDREKPLSLFSNKGFMHVERLIGLSFLRVSILIVEVLNDEGLAFLLLGLKDLLWRRLMILLGNRWLLLLF